jgi:diacylglycerol kinase family enzyme
VAGGGDGTINAVASVIAGSNIPLGVLPLGTLNHFAKDLGVPLELDAAIDCIVHGEHTAVDIGEVNDRVFINNSSLGIYPYIVRDREMQQRRFGRGKWLAFARAMLAALRHYSLLHVCMKLDSNDDKDMLDRRTPFVFIGNNEYLTEGFGIGTRSRLDAGQLSIYVAQRTGRLGLFRLALRALFGRLRQAKDFHALSTTELTVITRRSRLRVATDGEVTVMETPLHYRIRPGALRVIVPGKNTTGNSVAEPGPLAMQPMVERPTGAEACNSLRAEVTD